MKWDTRDVSVWLKSLGLYMYAPNFLDNEISGVHLSMLGRREFKELGVVPLGHRLTMELELKKLGVKQKDEE